MAIAWNVVATMLTGEFVRAKQLLERFGPVETMGFFNVLVLQADDPGQFLGVYSKRAAEDERLEQCVSRIVPMARLFDFTDAEDFEQKIRKEAMTFVSQLEGKAFHVRMKRRGLKGELSSLEEEQSLDKVLLDELERRGAPGRIDFDDPDAVIDIETVGNRAGAALWTREDLKRFPFLKVD